MVIIESDGLFIRWFKVFAEFCWSLLVSIVQPLKVIALHKMSFFLWTSFTLFGGLIGIVISVIRYTLFDDKSIEQAIYIESINGSFYTYSIAIVASLLSSLFIIFAERDKLNFRRYQIPLITILIFLMFFGGVFYALAKQTESISVYNIPKPEGVDIEWKQFVVFFLSLVFSVYSFCVCRLDEHTSEFSNISDESAKNTSPKIPRNIRQGTK